MEGDETAMDITPEGTEATETDKSTESQLKQAVEGAEEDVKDAEKRQQAAEGEGNKAIKEDTDKATELSLAEQRGYERALKELQAKAAAGQ